MDNSPRARPTLTTLPLEIRQAIFVSLASPAAAGRLALSCRVMYDALKGNEPLILYQMVQQRLGAVGCRLAMAHHEAILFRHEVIGEDWSTNNPARKLDAYVAKCLAQADDCFYADHLHESSRAKLAATLLQRYEDYVTEARYLSHLFGNLEDTWVLEDVIHVSYYHEILQCFDTRFGYTPMDDKTIQRLGTPLTVTEYLERMLFEMFEKLGACVPSMDRSDITVLTTWMR